MSQQSNYCVMHQMTLTAVFFELGVQLERSYANYLQVYMWLYPNFI